jgi:hypothetical protein
VWLRTRERVTGKRGSARPRQGHASHVGLRAEVGVAPGAGDRAEGPGTPPRGGAGGKHRAGAKARAGAAAQWGRGGVAPGPRREGRGRTPPGQAAAQGEGRAGRAPPWARACAQGREGGRVQGREGEGEGERGEGSSPRDSTPAITVSIT